MRILQVLPAYEPAWAFGGTVTAIATMCRNLVKNGAHVTVYTTDADGTGNRLNVSQNQMVDRDGVEVHYFSCDYGLRSAFYSKALVHSLYQNISNYDLVHVASVWQWHQWAVYRASKRFDKPYIISPHASLMNASLKQVGNIRLKRMGWQIWGLPAVKSARAIHFLCEGERLESASMIAQTPSFIVPNGIDCNRLSFQEQGRWTVRSKLDIPERAFTLLHLGRIHPKKNIDLVIRALYKLAAEGYTNIIYVICGANEDEEYRAFLEALIANLGIQDMVRWHEPIDNNQVASMLSAADLLVLPSKSEGISMVTLESMAVSLPVMVSDQVANYREILQDKAGIIIKPTVDSIKSALVELLTDREQLCSFSQNARQCAAVRYDVSRVSRLMLNAYEDVLTNTHRRELNWFPQ